MRRNHLYYGDNLTIMRTLPSSCVDLIYLDPPFNSQRSYNLIYKNLTGLPVPEQEEAFCDAWELDPEKEEMARNMTPMLREYGCSEDVVQFWSAWISALRGTQSGLLAYLLYMTQRLFEMRRLLRPNGSIFLHCDPSASHYIKVMMDSVFGHAAFRNEIIWNRAVVKGDAVRKFGANHDTILYYAGGPSPKFHPIYGEKTDEYSARFHLDDNDGRGLYRLAPLDSPNTRPNLTYEYKGYSPPTKGWRVSREVMEKLDAEGRLAFPKAQTGRIARKHYLSEQDGPKIGDVWTDIRPLQSEGERLGYQTQKPVALLKRLILAASDEGDVIFDPFCGCGTAIYAAHETKRAWLGCDIAILSVRIVRDVLQAKYGLSDDKDYVVSGVPLSVDGAKDLFERDKRQFQHWVVELAGGFVNSRHSGDLGIDGRLYFETNEGLRNMVISVKGGKLSPQYVRELRGTLEREKNSCIAGFICLETPTKGMLKEAAAAGVYTYLGKNYDRLQIRSVEDLLARRYFDTPSRVQTLDWQRQKVLAF